MVSFLRPCSLNLHIAGWSWWRKSEFIDELGQGFREWFRCLHCSEVTAMGHIAEIKTIPRYTWLFLVLSGLATRLSWLFYFKALQLGDVSRVQPIDKLSVVFTILLAFLILKEPLTPRVIAGGLLITAGAIVMIWR